MSALLAHGMTRAPSQPDWPPLALGEVRQLGAYYDGLGGADAIAWRSPRPFAASAIVATGAGSVFVKRHHDSVRTPADLAEEHAFIDHLRERGVPAPRVRRTTSGDSAVAVGRWSYEVHDIAEGHDLYRDALSWTPFTSLEHARSAGSALASLHGAAETFAAPIRRTAVLDSRFTVFASADPMTALEWRVAARPCLAAALAGRPWRADAARVLLPWHASLCPALAGLPSLWTHNDWHASNLLWSDASPGALVSGVIDFGLADRTNAMFDLATAIERNAINWLDLDGDAPIAVPGIAAALIEGYAARRPLAPVEARCLPAILPLVHAEFALAELEYFHGIVGSPANAELAYAFLLGHAAWFGRTEGRAFLREIGSLVQP